MAQIDEAWAYYKPKCAGKIKTSMVRPQICAGCRGWHDVVAECSGCVSLARVVSVSWNHWLWQAIAQVHNLLLASFRERRGVATLHIVPPEVGFALLRYFAWPAPGTNRAGPCYTPSHPSWKQGTTKSKSFHFIKFAYDTMAHVNWALPLHDYYHKTCSGPVRLVSKKRWQEIRFWGTPCQFKYVWAPQKKLESTEHGVGTFTIPGNVGHVSLKDGAPRWNTEYGRWVAEQQQEQLVAVKEAIQAFPRRPLRASHSLANTVHPLAEWATRHTPLPIVHQVRHVSVSDDESDGADESDGDSSDGESDGAAAPPHS